MRTDELDYILPQELIAQRPAEVRSGSQLLVLNRNNGKLTDTKFSDIGFFLRDDDLLIINDTKVLAARFFGRRKSGARLEGLFLSQSQDGLWKVMLKGARKLKDGEFFLLLDTEGKDYCQVQFAARENEKCLLKVKQDSRAEDILKDIGFAPLPPYIKRDSDHQTAEHDKSRYQTVYAEKSGAVAAPTAGLHFTTELIEQLKKRGIDIAKVTLHVGAGTFKPVSADSLEDHNIHAEYYSIDEETANLINTAKNDGRRIVAVGTTSVRTLETVGVSGQLVAGSGWTRLFIMPGFDFQIVDAIITNFHLPKSTLLALVGAFAGMDDTMAAYKHAVEKRYRFYSYGDAMFIE